MLKISKIAINPEIFIRPGTVFNEVAFRSEPDRKNPRQVRWSALISDHDSVTLVPDRQSGWTPQEDIPYTVITGRPISQKPPQPRKRGGLDFGIWTCRAQNSKRDELAYKTRAERNEQEAENRIKLRESQDKDLGPLKAQAIAIAIEWVKNNPKYKEAEELASQIKNSVEFPSPVPEIKWSPTDNPGPREQGKDRTYVYNTNAEWQGHNGSYRVSESVKWGTYRIPDSEYDEGSGIEYGMTSNQKKFDLVEGEDVVKFREDAEDTNRKQRQEYVVQNAISELDDGSFGEIKKIERQRYAVWAGIEDAIKKSLEIKFL